MTGCSFAFPMRFAFGVALLSGPEATAEQARDLLRDHGYSVLSDRPDPELGVWPEPGQAYLRVSAGRADDVASVVRSFGWTLRAALPATPGEGVADAS
ncbi:MAG: hypothetical protein ACTHMY_18070 [Solirubrobacteraceae bacterium]